MGRWSQARRRGGGGNAGALIPLTLVAAVYDPAESTLTLTFDRALDPVSVDGSQLILHDFTIGFEDVIFAGGGTISGVGDTVLTLPLASRETVSGSALTFQFTGDEPIKGLDGSTWPAGIYSFSYV